MDEGVPDVIAHPDLFMEARKKFGVKEEEITRAICRKAIEKGIPLEINFGKIASKLDSGMSIEEIKAIVLSLYTPLIILMDLFHNPNNL